jgi:hypothetical protein
MLVSAMLRTTGRLTPMAKVIFEPQASADDPMFSEAPSRFTPRLGHGLPRSKTIAHDSTAGRQIDQPDSRGNNGPDRRKAPPKPSTSGDRPGSKRPGQENGAHQMEDARRELR